MIEKLTQFLADVKQEMAKVSWPTREELLSSTYVVIGFSAAMAVSIFVIDQFLTRILGFFLS
jgi:preprotein translocase subunit SecE